jgi:hypothetical protein
MKALITQTTQSTLNNPLLNEMIKSIIRTNDTLTKTHDALINQINDLQNQLAVYNQEKHELITTHISPRSFKTKKYNMTVPTLAIVF